MRLLPVVLSLSVLIPFALARAEAYEPAPPGKLPAAESTSTSATTPSPEVAPEQAGQAASQPSSEVEGARPGEEAYRREFRPSALREKAEAEAFKRRQDAGESEDSSATVHQQSYGSDQRFR